MARNNDVLYITFQADGTDVRKPAPSRKKPKKPASPGKRLIRLDPAAIAGMAIALCMLILMGAGLGNLHAARQEKLQMQQQVEQLTRENTWLKQTYEDSYDLEEVKQAALEMGMVPADQVENIPIQMEVPKEEPEDMDFFEQMTAFLASLFA